MQQPKYYKANNKSNFEEREIIRIFAACYEKTLLVAAAKFYFRKNNKQL